MSEHSEQAEQEALVPLERRTYLMSLASGATATGVAGGAAAASSSAGQETTPADDPGYGDSWVGYGRGEYSSGVYGDVAPPAIPGLDAPAQDLNGDGLHEDIDGDGEFTIFDVQAFFNNFNGETVQRYAPFFDFNQNGEVTIFDVQALFNKLQDWDEN